MMVQKIRLIRWLVILVVWFSATTVVQSGEPGKKLPDSKAIRILTVGNSFSNNACTYLESIAGSVPGCKIKIEKASLGGCSLQRHASLIDTCEMKSNAKPYSEKYCLKDLLQMEKYDFITIQQVSTSSFKVETYQPYADKLIAFIRQHAPQSEIVVHQTWAYAANSQRLKDWGMSRQEMHRGLTESYFKLAATYGFDVLPSGSAFIKATSLNPSIDLWNPDRYHANMNGCYLSGCVWFGKFFGISPGKVNFIPEGMTAETAEFLRKTAEKTIKKQKTNKL